MSLLNLIKTSYGIEDRIFAGHEYDRQSAMKALNTAQDENVGFEEFIRMHQEFLQNQNCSEEHINRQLNRVKNLELYFRLD